MVHRKRAPNGPNHVNFKVTSSSDPEVEQSSYVHVESCSWQFPGWPQWAQGGGGGNGFGEGA